MSNAGTAPVDHNPEIQSELSRLSDCQHLLHEDLQHLCRRLEPVLAQKPTEAQSEKDQRSVSTPLGRDIAEQMELAVQSRKYVQYLLECLEL